VEVPSQFEGEESVSFAALAIVRHGAHDIAPDGAGEYFLGPDATECFAPSRGCVISVACWLFGRKVRSVQKQGTRMYTNHIRYGRVKLFWL